MMCQSKSRNVVAGSLWDPRNYGILICYHDEMACIYVGSRKNSVTLSTFFATSRCRSKISTLYKPHNSPHKPHTPFPESLG